MANVWDVLLCAALVSCFSTWTKGIYLTGSDDSHALYPRWNACANASLQFDFRTESPRGLLMYMDDLGKYEFLEVVLNGSYVVLTANLVEKDEHAVQLAVRGNFDDNRWHRCGIERNRAEITLQVDGAASSAIFLESGMNFGENGRSSYVYFGGLAPKYASALWKLSLPSVIFNARFKGYIQNVIYGNCSCLPVRGRLLSGRGVAPEPRDQCDLLEDACGKDCLCISTDDSYGCDCHNSLKCSQGE